MLLVTETTTTVVVGVFATVVAQIVTLLTLMFNGRQQRLREERNRRWMLEDRAAMASQVTKAVTESHDDLAHRHDTIQAAIADNTRKTEDATAAAHVAYKEANDVNLKIAALGYRFRKEDQQT